MCKPLEAMQSIFTLFIVRCGIWHIPNTFFYISACRRKVEQHYNACINIFGIQQCNGTDGNVVARFAPISVH